MVVDSSRSPAPAADAASADEPWGQEGWGLGTPAAGTAAASEALNDAFWGLEIQLLTNAGYHSDREAFFAFVGRCAAASSVVLGSAALAVLAAKQFAAVAPWLAFAVAVAGAVNLVFAPATAARDSRDLKRRYLDLYSRVVGREFATVTTARRELLKIAADAPPDCEAAKAVAYNNVLKSIYEGRHLADAVLVVSRWERVTAFLCRRSGTVYRRRGEIS